MNRLSELYKEKTKLALLRQTNIQFLRKLVNEKDLDLLFGGEE